MEVLKVTTVEEVVSILLPQTPEKARELVRWSFYKRPPRMPSWFLWDFIELLPADCHLLLPSLRRILSIIRATFEEKLLLQGCCNGPFIGCDDFLLLPHLFLSKLCCTVSQADEDKDHLKTRIETAIAALNDPLSPM